MLHLELETKHALSQEILTLTGNIPGNLDVGLAERDYFPLADTAAMARRMEELAAIPVDAEAIALRRDQVSQRDDWHDVAASTPRLYQTTVSGSNPG